MGLALLFGLGMMTLLLSCDMSLRQKRVLSTVAALTLSISGPNEVRAGQSIQFTSTMSTAQEAPLTWSVNGIPGGSADSGIIGPTGLYAAPDHSQQVTVSAAVSDAKSISASQTVIVLNPIPTITSAAVVSSGSDQYRVDVRGSGFILDSALFLDGISQSPEFIGPDELEMTVPVSDSVGRTSTVEVSNPSPGAATSNAVALSFPPTELQPLLGCNNPNTGTPIPDWGPAAAGAPNYIENFWRHQFGIAPSYSSNTIFWTSRENGPGQSVLITGAFSPAIKKARIAAIPQGVRDWQSLVDKSLLEVPATAQLNTGLSFIVPTTLPAGVYGFKIEDPTAKSVYELVNVPSINWMVGTPSDHSSTNILKSSVHTCGVEAGQTLRIFGKNFTASQKVVLQSPNGTITSLVPTQQDTNSLAVVIPNKLTAGTYSLWVGNSSWDATSSLATALAVISPLQWKTNTVSCSGLNDVARSDISRVLQNCMNANAPAEGSKQLTYITVPPGTFVLASPIKLPPYEALVGSTNGDSKIICKAATVPAAWIYATKSAGLANLSIEAPGGSAIFGGAVKTGDPGTSGHLVLDQVSLRTSQSVHAGDATPIVDVYGPDIQIYDSNFASGTTRNVMLTFGDGAILSGNDFDNTTAYNSISASQNVIFDHNCVFSQTGPGASGNSALSINRPWCNYCKSMASRNHYVGYNSFAYMGRPPAEIVTLDGGGDDYVGSLVSSTADTVTLANDPSWIKTGNTDPSLVPVLIISGRGVGQYSYIKSYQGRKVTLVSPWKVIPDSSSEVAIRFIVPNLIISHNTITDTVGWSFNVYGAVEAVIEDNLLTDSGGGMKLNGTLFNTDVLRNTILPGSRQFLSLSPNDNKGGIGLWDGQGGFLVSGMMVRNNYVTPLQTINNSNGIRGVNANLIELNEAVWSGPPFSSVPGYLVQNNTAPQ